MNDSIDELFNAVKQGKQEEAEQLGSRMKATLSDDKKQMLEKALDDREYLKTLLSSDKAKSVIEELKKKGIG